MLFTMILEFDDVTSVMQVRAVNQHRAVEKWLEGLADPIAYGFDAKTAQRIQTALAQSKNLQGGRRAR